MKNLTNLGQMWPKYLLLTTFAYNTFNTPNLVDFSPYELAFRRKPKALLNLETKPDIKVAGTFNDYHNLLNKRLEHLHKPLQDLNLKRLAIINKDQAFFQCNSRDLVYIKSPLMNQLCTASRKVMIKYVGPVVIYKIIDPHNYLLKTLDSKILKGLFEQERLKPAMLGTSEGNVSNLSQLKHLINIGLLTSLY